MAESKKKKSADTGRVEVFIPRGGKGDEQSVFVSVNGVNYLLPRGKSSMVPPEVAQELERANEARASQEERIDALLDR